MPDSELRLLKELLTVVALCKVKHAASAASQSPSPYVENIQASNFSLKCLLAYKPPQHDSKTSLTALTRNVTRPGLTGGLLVFTQGLFGKCKPHQVVVSCDQDSENILPAFIICILSD